MSDMTPTSPITLDDIRHKALHIRDEVKDEVQTQVLDRRAQLVAIGVFAVLAVVGIAYFAGSRAGRRASAPDLY